MRRLVCAFSVLFLTPLCNVVAYADVPVQIFVKIAAAGSVVSTGIGLIVASLKYLADALVK